MPNTTNTEPTISHHAGPLRRIRAAVLDLAVVGVWLGVAGMVGLVLRLYDGGFNTPAGWDMFAFATVVAPVVITFALMEASPQQATPGKRRLGLLVVGPGGQRLSPARSLARSTVKFAPWQLAHTAVFQIAGGNTALPYLAMSLIAQLLALASVAEMLLGSRHRSFHDLVARTNVVTCGQENDSADTTTAQEPPTFAESLPAWSHVVH